MTLQRLSCCPAVKPGPATTFIWLVCHLIHLACRPTIPGCVTHDSKNAHHRTARDRPLYGSPIRAEWATSVRAA